MARRLGVALASAAALAAIVHCGPGVTTLRTIRVRLFPALSGLGDPGHVALTFDDGPDPRSTPEFLSVLDKLAVRATFFVLGERLNRHRGLGRDLAGAGHEVAVHGWDHRALVTRSAGSLRGGLIRTRDLVTEVTGARPAWFRPPYGMLTTAALIAAREADLMPVLWSSWGKDWRSQSTSDSILATVLTDLGPAATVLLHDRSASTTAWRASLAAVPRIVAACVARGLTVGPLAEHGLPR